MLLRIQQEQHWGRQENWTKVCQGPRLPWQSCSATAFVPCLQSHYTHHTASHTSYGIQGDARFVLTTKGARILLSLKSAAEELQPVLEEAKDFSPLSFKVASFPVTHYCLLLRLQRHIF